MSSTTRASIRIGQSVWVVQKHHQGSGQLTRGTVAAILTNSSQHHRGIKVRTTDGIVGRVAKLAECEDDGFDDSQYVFVEGRNATSSSSVSREQPPSFREEDWPALGSSKWPCSQCTFINPPNAKQCEMCDAQKEQHTIRIPNFCEPNSTAGPTYGFGCGHGVCSEDGTYCRCEPGYAYSRYHVNYPDCWEGELARPAILTFLGLVCAVNCILLAYAASKSRKTMRTSAIFAFLGSFFLGVFAFTLHLEGYVGIACAAVICLNTTCMAISLGLIAQALFKPAFDNFGEANPRLGKTIMVYQIGGFSLSPFIFWVIPYPFGAAGDWDMYNRLTLVLTWGIAIVFFVFVIAPYNMILIKFEEKVTMANEVVAVGGGNRSMVNDVLEQMKNLRIVLLQQLPPMIVTAVYVTICVLGLNQMGLQGLIFLSFWFPPATICFRLGRFFLAVADNKRKPVDASNSTLNSKNSKNNNHAVAAATTQMRIGDNNSAEDTAPSQPSRSILGLKL